LANADWIDETSYAAFFFVSLVVVRASEVSLLFSFFDGGGNGLFVIDFKFGRGTFVKSGDFARGVFDDAFFFTFAFCGDFNDFFANCDDDFFCGVFFVVFLFGRPKVWPEKVSYRLLTKSIFEFFSPLRRKNVVKKKLLLHITK